MSSEQLGVGRTGLTVHVQNGSGVAAGPPCTCVHALPSGDLHLWGWGGSVAQILLALILLTVSAKRKLRMLSI